MFYRCSIDFKYVFDRLLDFCRVELRRIFDRVTKAPVRLGLGRFTRPPDETGFRETGFIETGLKKPGQTGLNRKETGFVRLGETGSMQVETGLVSLEAR